jgi:hypothetical protein
MPRGTQSPGVPDIFARNVYLALDDFGGRSIIDATVTGAVAIDTATIGYRAGMARAVPDRES